MRRFLLHYTTDTIPPLSVDWECVQFSNGMIAVSLRDKIITFASLDALCERFAAGTRATSWLDDEREWTTEQLADLTRYYNAIMEQCGEKRAIITTVAVMAKLRKMGLAPGG